MPVWLSITLGILLFIVITIIMVLIGISLFLLLFSPIPPPKSSPSNMLFTAVLTSIFWGVLGALWFFVPAALIFQLDIGRSFNNGMLLFVAPILLIKIIRIGKATKCPSCHIAFQAIVVGTKHGYIERDVSPHATDQIYRSIIEYRCDNCQHTWVVDESNTYKDVDV